MSAHAVMVGISGTLGCVGVLTSWVRYRVTGKVCGLCLYLNGVSLAAAITWILGQ